MLLLVSITLNVTLFQHLLDYNRDRNKIRLDPLGLDVYSGDARPPDSSAIRVVLFGDSRAQQWPSPEVSDSYTFINRGIGAQTSAQVRLRFAAHVQPLKPDVLLIQMCINDLKTIPLFPESRDSLVTDCQQNIAAILDEARAMGTVVILTTIFPVGPPPLQRWLVWSDDIARAVETANDSIRSLASDDVIILDAYALLVDSNGLLRADLSVDELHLNAAGYALLNQSLIPLIQTIGESRGTN